MNEKNLKIMCKFLLFLIVSLVIVFVGISNIFALETKTVYSTNSSGTLVGQNTYTYGYINQGGVQTTSSASINATVNDRALALIFYMYEPVLINKTYTMEINFKGNDLINTFTSSMVQISTCNAEVCNDNAIVSVIKNNPNGMSNKLTIEFNPITSGSILMVNLSDKTRTFYITGLYNQQTFGISSVKLESTNQNQDIIDNQTNNTNNIINNNNSNTQEIINNQNQNTQDIIDSNKVCNDLKLTYNNVITTGQYLNTSGSIRNSGPWGITDYYEIKSIFVNNTTNYDGYSMCFYTKDKILISCQNYSSMATGNYSLPSNTYYARFSIRSTNVPILTINYCTNGQQAVSDNISELNDSINSTDFDVSGLDNAVGWLPAGPVDSILNLPLNLFNAYSTALGLTCSPLNIPLPYVSKNLPIPCLRSIFQEIGIYNWWEGFGYLAAAIILYNYLLNLYTWVDKTLTLRENTMPGYYDDKFGGGA